ncbi:MAG: DUF72 domain-containing protein [Candidatus Eisenbacteria bacterium]|uniref:DUF72 domain-containing protein n=1 Tax=Eiseniibacteriota bacterium TaxID=2212470 RepID=A0A7Y2ECL0_UNCEI|nr:DUF72 domain-containing protein [Candidatus Eisenbacteria bacterium]
MLKSYGEKLPTVELNNTFYRMPKRVVLETWASRVPDDFRFSIKASRRITHIRRLKDAQSEIGFLFQNLEVLGEKLGVVLAQLPPTMKVDVERLKLFLEMLPGEAPVSFEFRHPSWHCEEVYDVLQAHQAGVVTTDAKSDTPEPMRATSSIGYFRLRKPEYPDQELDDIAASIKAQPWAKCFVFFKHEEEAIGPLLAMKFQERF